MRYKEYYRVECEGGLEDIQLETLRDDQLNIAGVSVPVGIESFFKMNCKIYKIKEDLEKGTQEKEEIGFFNYDIGVDEAKLKVVFEFSDEELFRSMIRRW